MKGMLAGIDGTTLRKAVRDPRRAVLRLVLRSRLARLGLEEERRRLVSFLSRRFDADGSALLAEYRSSEFAEWIRERRAALARHPGPYRLGTTGEFGCEALYLLVRAARPRVVVETGVLYGASSAHLLAALDRNGSGELHSVEIGRDPGEPPHDHFVPGGLRSRWRLIIGDSRRELPRLLDRCGPIDLFYHDSLHTFEHMSWEFGTALPHIGPSGLLATDDVLNPPSLVGIFRDGPFAAFCKRRGIASSTFHNLGIALPSLPSSARRQAA